MKLIISIDGVNPQEASKIIEGINTIIEVQDMQPSVTFSFGDPTPQKIMRKVADQLWRYQ